jgi:hypothetical protein
MSEYHRWGWGAIDNCMSVVWPPLVYVDYLIQNCCLLNNDKNNLDLKVTLM